ncbi:MAG: nuclear transport factor 2 family protein [Novosphingobium sp.]|nr:nuclear transport factor 2 family protein [Novosphingobium sp.]
MQDAYEIQQVINTYSQAASIGDWDRAVGTYLPDGVWAIPHLGMTLDGAEAIRAALVQFMDTMDYVLQLNTPALVTVTGDTARATSSIRESGKTKGKLQAFEYLGMYEDELVRTAQGWRFSERVFRGIGTSHFPMESGEAH